MRISDWSSDVCSSDLLGIGNRFVEAALRAAQGTGADVEPPAVEPRHREAETVALGADAVFDRHLHIVEDHLRGGGGVPAELALLGAEADPRHVLFDDEARNALRSRLTGADHRSEEHTSELQSLMRISYAVFCLKKKKNK